MSDRPQVPNWNNINANKPEEYSSEFILGNLRYANVTNASTGQRQLYLVSGLGGTSLTQRSLLSSTNQNGTVTKGEAYDSFVRQFGADTLKKAEDANKQQSVKLLTTPGVSTQAESQSIKTSKEFKSTAAGSNSGKPTGQDQTAAAQTQKDLEDLAPGTRYKKDAKGNTPFSLSLRYPDNLQVEQQDVIEFNMLSYEKRSFSEQGNNNLGSFKERSNYTSRTIGRVVLPIPGGISDTNAVTWGSDSLPAAKKALADFANSIITGGVESGANTLENQAGQASASSSEIQQGIAAYFTQQAIGASNILSRTQGAIQNPNMELLFSSPTLRPFSFTFKLSARGKRDKDQITKIIRFFKQGMAVQRTASQLFLKAPNTFKIRYLHKTKDHPYINFIKECALQSFTVNYTPEGNYMTFADGLMTSYEITMQFQELDPIFNDDYANLPGGNTDTVIGY